MSAPSLPNLLVSHWQPTWPLEAEAALAIALYLVGVTRVRGGWPRWRTGSFLAGVAVVLIALQSGIDAYDDQLLSVHMVQHMLLLMLAPVLVLGGAPTALALRALRAGQRRAFARGLARARPLARPWVCLAAFDAVVLATHLPWFYDATLRHPFLHDGEHAAYLAVGLVLWWPLLDSDPVRSHRLGGLGRLVYVLAAMPAMALIGAYLNRDPTLAYAPYAAAAHRLGVNAVVDQQQAGAIMWVAGSLVLVAVGLWASIDALLDEERRQRVREAHR